MWLRMKSQPVKIDVCFFLDHLPASPTSHYRTPAGKALWIIGQQSTMNPLFKSPRHSAPPSPSPCTSLLCVLCGEVAYPPLTLSCGHHMCGTHLFANGDGKRTLLMHKNAHMGWNVDNRGSEPSAGGPNALGFMSGPTVPPNQLCFIGKSIKLHL